MNSQDDESQQLAASRLQILEDASAYAVTLGIQKCRDRLRYTDSDVVHTQTGYRFVSASTGISPHPNAGGTEVRKTEPMQEVRYSKQQISALMAGNLSIKKIFAHTVFCPPHLPVTQVNLLIQWNRFIE